MTTVKINISGRCVKAEITGHAGYNPGNDIVCAAASVLASTLAQSVQKMFGTGEVERINEFTYKKERVYVDFITSDDQESAAAVNVMLSVIATGYELLVTQYPKHVILVVEY